MPNKKYQEGFSLIEVIVSIIVFIVVIIGVTALISFNISNSALLRNRLIAANLAQEGIEIVRNIRDKNFLDQESDHSIQWNRDLSAGNNYRVVYNSHQLLSPADVPLYFHNSSGIFDYDSVGATPSIFYRTVSIQNINSNEIRVTSTVSWRERGQDFSLSVQDHLFNWK